MDPVTHLLTGACIGRAGLNRRTAYATLAAVLAADAPDIDVLWGIAGPVAGFEHHRGITHTLIAAPVMALAVTGAVWLLRRGWSALPWVKSRQRMDQQPVNWLWIYLTALIADLSHLLLDWTNNYGLRPFFPFNKHWYSGDFVFIAEPVIWGLLTAAMVFPWLLSLADTEVGARRVKFRGRGWAIFALSGMVVVWCWRWAEHAQARTLVENAALTSAPVRRIAVEPYPANPYRWHALVETDAAWQTAEVDTFRGTVASDEKIDSIEKPPSTPAIEIARRSELGQVYLDWAQWPLVRDVGRVHAPGSPGLALAPPQMWTTVQFSDLRFAYSYLNFGGTGGNSLGYELARSPLTGWVYVVDGREEAGEFLDGREQK